MFNDTIPYNAKIISTITRHSVGVVEKAITTFLELRLIEILDNGAMYLLQIQNLIGKSTTEADRIRGYRKKIADEKRLLSCTNSVQMYDKCTPELDIRVKERGKELELNTNMSHPADKATPKSKYSDEVTRIFEHWKTTMGHEKAKLDDDRKKNIIKALNNGFSEADICMAITGCSKTPHNMGDNDRGQRYNGLSVILKNADQTQRFINNYENPPLEVLDAKPKYKPGSRDEKLAMLERMAK